MPDDLNQQYETVLPDILIKNLISFSDAVVLRTINSNKDAKLASPCAKMICPETKLIWNRHQ